ncbi:MAG: sodium:alanine symporter family protein [Rouxiella badensis]|jgi:AGCS family alanine or glycine:cation symporter|uniref:alanine/glycine:cation symporter family protein n=1 Tax=Rouxiella badensis TaxID=1646377 RepID=UPI003C695314
MASLLNFLDDILWESILIYFLLGFGIYLTLRTRFIQFRRWREMFLCLRRNKSADARGVSSFQSLAVTLSGRIGVGSLTGVAMAITTGGPGAIFWMWIITLLGMPIALIENTLAQVFKTTDNKMQFRGGPSEYMSRGLGMRWMGVLFSVLMILIVGFVFNVLQAKAVTQAVAVAFNLTPWHISIALGILFALTLAGGLRTLVKVSVWLAPIMCLSYMLLAFWVMAVNVDKLPEVFLLIFKSAFGFQEFAAGALGYGVTIAMTQGIQQGLFSNEAGSGSTPHIAAMAASRHPANQGFTQMLGVLVDTFVVCSATAMIILSSGMLTAPTDKISGITLLTQAVSGSIGSFGPQLLAIFMLIFGFTTMMTNCMYAENNLLFLQRGKTGSLYLLRLAMLVMLLVGSFIGTPLLMQTASISLAVITMINLTALLLLSGLALKVVRDFERQRVMGREPVFNSGSFPELKGQLQDGIWK